MKRIGLIPWVLTGFVLLIAAVGAIYRGTHHAHLRLPAPAEQHYRLGLLLAQKGNPGAAVYQWNTAIGLNPTFAPAYLAIAQQEEQRGDLTAAAISLERLRAANPHAPRIAGRIAALYFRAGRYEKGIALAREAVRSEPDDPLAHAVLGQGFAQAGDMERSLQEFRTAYRLAPTDEPILFDLARSLGRVGRVDDALSLVRPKLTQAQNPARACFIMGELLMRQNSPQAETYLKRSLALAPGQASVQSDLGSLLLREGRPAEAQPLLERAYRQDPTDVDALRNLATVYARLKRPAANQAKQALSALDTYNSALKRARLRYLSHPDDGSNSLLLAQLEAQRGNGQDAIDVTMQILRTDPNNPAALALLHRLMGH